MLFHRCSTDGTRIDASHLINSYAGIEPSPVWILGSSDTLNQEEIDLINASDIPVFGMNYSGRGKEDGRWKIKPDLWTAFDSTSRFHKSIFLDPSIMKFVREMRHLDLIPETDHKLCDATNTYFFPNENRDYSNFFSEEHQTINHSLDSFIQALDIAYRLGFRTFYCVNTELRIRPSEAQIELAKSHGVEYENGMVHRIEPKERIVAGKLQNYVEDYWSDLLIDFVRECLKNQVATSEEKLYETMESLDRESQYSFDEQKSFRAAVQSDSHYWERVQYLRLARKNMSLKGISLYTCSDTSRLYPWFSHVSVKSACEKHSLNAHLDALSGLYSGRELKLDSLPFHKDIKPYKSNTEVIKPEKEPCHGCKKKTKQDQGIQDKIREIQLNDQLEIIEIL